MFKYISAILLLLISFSQAVCAKPTDFPTPAQSQIDAYTLQAKECKRIAIDNQEGVKATEPAAQPKPDMNTLFAIGENDIVLGNHDAPVIVIEYASPTCAHCAFFNKVIYPQLRKNYIDTGKIAYSLRLFIGTKQDLDAGILTLCGSKTIFYKLVDVLLERQESWAFNSKYRDILTNIGQLSGIEPEQYAACLGNTDLSDILINQSRAAGRVPGFVGTPTFFINGVQLKQAYTYENLSAAIEAALKEKK